MTSTSMPSTTKLPRYSPSGHLETAGIAKFIFYGFVFAMLLGGIYAYLTDITWPIPGTLIGAVFAAVVCAVVASQLAKRAHSRSLRFNAMACGGFGFLVMGFKWWFTFVEIGGWLPTWELLTSGPLAWLGAIASLSQKIHLDAAHHPSKLGLLVAWGVECAMVVAMTTAIGRSEAAEPYSERERAWAEPAFDCELFEPDGSSSDLFERMAAHGATPLLCMQRAHELQATPISSKWWTVKVAAKWVQADPLARWIDLTIIQHTRDTQGKVSSKQEQALMHWQVNEETFAKIRAHAIPTTASAPEPETSQPSPPPTPVELQPAVAALEADQFAVALSLAKAYIQHPQLHVKTDALRLCALALSRQGHWAQAFDHYHQLFLIEPTTMNALQAATTSVVAGELVRGQAWFEQAERLNHERHEIAQPKMHIQFLSALEQAGETAACMPHLNWLVSAYKLHVYTDSHLLWVKGLPFFGVFLEKALPILSYTLNEEAVRAWYISLRDSVDDDGKVQVDGFLAKMTPQGLQP